MTCHVYVMAGATPTVKIGISFQPKVRRQQVQLSVSQKLHVVATWRFDTSVEARLAEGLAHSSLIAFREPSAEGREWFALSAAAAVGAVNQIVDTWLSGEQCVANVTFFPLRPVRYTHAERAEETRQETIRRAELIRDDWRRRDHTTRDLLARAGVKPGKPMAPATAKAHLGSRREAQADYEREQAREAGRRAGKTPGRKPKP